MVERQVEAAVAQALQDGQSRSHFLGGRMAQRGDFEYHLLGVDQLQVAAGQALVGAIDEDELLADQLIRASVRQGREHQRHIAGSGVGLA